MSPRLFAVTTSHSGLPGIAVSWPQRSLSSVHFSRSSTGGCGGVGGMGGGVHSERDSPRLASTATYVWSTDSCFTSSRSATTLAEGL